MSYPKKEILSIKFGIAMESIIACTLISFENIVV